MEFYNNLEEIFEKVDASQKKIKFELGYGPIPYALRIINQKLRYGGQLELIGYDFDEISRCYLTGHLTLDQAREKLYNGRNDISSCLEVNFILQSFGLFIIERRINDFMFYVKATRPSP